MMPDLVLLQFDHGIRLAEAKLDAGEEFELGLILVGLEM